MEGIEAPGEVSQTDPVQHFGVGRDIQRVVKVDQLKSAHLPIDEHRGGEERRCENLGRCVALMRG